MAKATQKTEAVAEFQRHAVQRLPAAIPTTNPRRVTVFAHDESRFVLRSIRPRRSTARGVERVDLNQHDLQNFYLYDVVAPTSHENFMLVLPQLSSTHFQIFLDDVAVAY